MRKRGMMHLAVALMGAQCALSMAAAQAPAANGRATYTLDIPAQDLNDALQALALVSNYELLYSSKLVEGIRSLPLKGKFTTEQAVKQLLSGTNLTYEVTADRLVVIHLPNMVSASFAPTETNGLRLAQAGLPPGSQDESVEGASPERKDGLEEVVVQGAKRKFAPTDSSAATKIPMDIIDTPQSLSVLSSELMSIVGAKSVTKALEWVPGVTNTSPEIGLYNLASVRGFGLSDFNSYKIHGLAFSGIAIPLDLEVIDSLEVVRGPAAIIYGESDYGGTINVRLKRPRAKPAFTGGWGGDVDGSSRFSADVTGALTADERLRGRLSLSYGDGRSPQSLAYARSTSIAPSLSWDLTDHDTLDLNVILQHRPLRFSWGFGLTEDLKLPAVAKDAFIGADFGVGNTDTKMGLVQFTHRFNERWTLTVGGLSDKVSRQGNEVYILDPIAVNGDVPLYQWGHVSRIDDYAGDVTLTGDFMALGHAHTLALSASKRRTGETYYGFGGGYVDGVFNVYHPDPYNSVTPLFPYLPDDQHRRSSEIFHLADESRIVQQSQGVSGILLLHPLARTTVLMGLRHTKLSVGYKDIYFGTPTAADFKTDATNKRLGVVYEVANDVNLYASYSDGTIPNWFTRTVSSGAVLPAETGVQLEAGIKAALFGKKLTLASSIFQIDRQNIAVHDPSTPPDSPFSILINGQKHRGFEFEAIGEPVPGLNLIASYSYLDIKINMCVREAGICTDPFGYNGHQQPNSPKHMLKLYSTYQLLSGPLHGLSLGGGVVHASQRDVDGTGMFQLPAYTRVDARIGYDALEHVSFSLNAINLADADIYTSRFWYLYGGIDYQDRRTVMFDVSFKY